jgi:hypothetical protein
MQVCLVVTMPVVTRDGGDYLWGISIVALFPHGRIGGQTTGCVRIRARE